MVAHPLELLNHLPVFTDEIQLAEHQQSTPENFNLAPVLRRKQERIRAQLNPPLAEGLLELAEGMTGDLYISEASLVFFSTSLNKGVSIPYPAIALHAISRQPMRPWQPAEGTDGAVEAPLADVGLSGGPCIYCQIDESGGDRAEEEDSDQAGMLRDLILTPEDASAIEPIFEALSDCASLFPSTLSEDEGPAFADADVNGHLANGHVEDSEVGAAARDYLDSLVDWSTVPARQAAPRVAEVHPAAFEDAEEYDESPTRS